MAIGTYIAQFNPAAAERTAAAFVDAANGLLDFPDRGRQIRPGVRELTTIRNYIIQYSVLPGEVRIITIRHAARRPEP